MKGFPKYFNTKQDYINCLSLFPSETKQALRALMNNRYKWIQDGELEKESDGINDDDHYVVKTNKEDLEQVIINHYKSMMVRKEKK